MKEGADIQKAHQPAAGYIQEEIGTGCEYGEVLEEEAEDEIDRKIIQQKTAEYSDRILTGKKMRQDHTGIQANHKAGGQKIQEHEPHQQPEDKGFTRPPASPKGLPLVQQERQDHGSS